MNVKTMYAELEEAKRNLDSAESGLREIQSAQLPAAVRNAAYATVQRCAEKVQTLRAKIQAQLATEGQGDVKVTAPAEDVDVSCIFYLACPDQDVYAQADLKVDRDGAWSLIIHNHMDLVPVVTFGDMNTPVSAQFTTLFQGSERSR